MVLINPAASHPFRLLRRLLIHERKVDQLQKLSADISAMSCGCNIIKLECTVARPSENLHQYLTAKMNSTASPHATVTAHRCIQRANERSVNHHQSTQWQGGTGHGCQHTWLSFMICTIGSTPLLAQKCSISAVSALPPTALPHRVFCPDTISITRSSMVEVAPGRPHCSAVVHDGTLLNVGKHFADFLLLK